MYKKNKGFYKMTYAGRVNRCRRGTEVCPVGKREGERGCCVVLSVRRWREKRRGGGRGGGGGG